MFAAKSACGVAAQQAVASVVLVARADTYAEESLGFAAAHSEQAVAGQSAQRLAEVEVVGILSSLFALRLDDAGADNSCAFKGSAERGADLLVFAHALSQDVARTLQGVGSSGHFVGQIFFRQLFGVGVGVEEYGVGKRFESALASRFGTRFALRLVGQVDVL